MYPNKQPYSRRPDAANFAHQYSSPQIQTNGSTNGQVNGHVNGPSVEIPDIIVEQFYNDQIIQTINNQNDIIYFCFFCNSYIKDLSKVASHVMNSYHIEKKSDKRYDRGLNKKFVMKTVDEKAVEYLSENERLQMIAQELNRIPNNAKHFFWRRGIRLMNCIGEYAYYCKTCDQPISSFTQILNHFKSECHLRLENRESLVSHIDEHEINKSWIPIIGLKFITEYGNKSLTELVYKCNLCQVFDNAYKMYLHLLSYEHRLNLVNQLENTVYENLNEDQLNHCLNVYKKREGPGFMVKSKELPVVYGNDWSQSLEEIRAIFGSVKGTTCDSMEKLFAVRIRNEIEANNLVAVIEKIKEATVKYYSNRSRDNYY